MVHTLHLGEYVGGGVFLGLELALFSLFFGEVLGQQLEAFEPAPKRTRKAVSAKR